MSLRDDLNEYSDRLLKDAQSLISYAYLMQEEFSAAQHNSQSHISKRKQNEKFYFELSYYEKLEHEIKISMDHFIRQEAEEEKLRLEEEKRYYDKEKEQASHSISHDSHHKNSIEANRLIEMLNQLKSDLLQFILKIESHLSELNQFMNEIHQNILIHQESCKKQFEINIKKFLTDYTIENNQIIIPYTSGNISIQYDRLIDRLKHTYEVHLSDDTPNIDTLKSEIQNAIKDEIQKSGKTSKVIASKLSSDLSQKIVHNQNNFITQAATIQIIQKKQLKLTQLEFDLLTKKRDLFNHYTSQTLKPTLSKQSMKDLAQESSSSLKNTAELLIQSKKKLTQSGRVSLALSDISKKLTSIHPKKSTPTKELHIKSNNK